MRLTFLAAAIFGVSVSAAAQSHEAAKPAAKTAPAPTDAPAAKPAPAPAEHAAPAAAKAGAGRATPVVSRVTAEPTPSAKAGEAAAAEDRLPAAKGKPKPLVSGAKAAGHGTEMPAGPRVSGLPAAKPAAEAAPAPSAHAAPAAHDEHPPGAAPTAIPAATRAAANPKAPVKLSTVHGRITAALAELRTESGSEAKGESDGHGEAKGAAAKGRPAPAARPRFVVSWPAARWHVAWRDDLDRVIVSWPD